MFNNKCKSAQDIRALILLAAFAHPQRTPTEYRPRTLATNTARLPSRYTLHNFVRSSDLPTRVARACMVDSETCKTCNCRFSQLGGVYPLGNCRAMLVYADHAGQHTR
eukprot:1193152-Prorocentrum_minimum.AAC.2